MKDINSIMALNIQSQEDYLKRLTIYSTYYQHIHNIAQSFIMNHKFALLDLLTIALRISKHLILINVITIY